MKKIFIIIILAILILICISFITSNQFTQEENNINSVPDENTQITETANTYVDDNPIKLGIYLLDSSKGKRLLVNELSNTWTYHKDIYELNVIYTKEKEIDGTATRECFPKYLAEYEDVSEYRTGFHINFKTEDKEFDKTILSPKDVDEFYDFLEVYLYDGYHRKKGEWYSHTTEEEFNENTIFTTIKLTAGKNIDKIISDITLTAFSYDEDDFDEYNNYIGNSKYTITVKKS